MAEKRMFTKSIIDSDRFLEMPLSTQALYFHLGMRADDEGFINSPKKIIRAVNCNEDDLKLLIAKGFVICFDTGIIAITHWKLHNHIQKDRFKPTLYEEEKSLLDENNRKEYILKTAVSNSMDTKCIQIVSNADTKNRLDKNRIDKDSIVNVSTAVDVRNASDYQGVVDLFNSVCISLPKVQKLNDKRRKLIVNADKLLGEMTFEGFFNLVESSDFLTGRNGKWSGCGFDWILNPANLTKIIEGNYLNKANPMVNSTANTQRNYDEEF